MTKSNWKKCKLGDICEDISYGYTASANSQHVGPKFLRITDIIPYFIDWDSVPYCDIEKDLISKYKLELGDIVIARTGATSGFNSLIDKEVDAVFASFLIRFRLNKEIAFPRFIKYTLKSDFYKEFIANNIGGSAQPGINAKTLSLFQVDLPPLYEQKRIAGVLGAFDDKIELLQKQNKTLEEMAKAIFKSWFVDFDIVKAKQKGEKKEDIIKNYHLTEELYNLFPSSFIDSSLGPIPLGWEVDKLINRCTIMLGGTPSRLKKEYWKHGTIPWIASGKVNDFRIATPSEYITQEGLNNSATKLMPKRTTVIAITGATLGQISLTEIECCANQSVVSVLGDKDLFSEYIYFWIQHNINLLLSKQTGGAQQHINKNDVESLLVLVPSNNILKPYLHQVKPLFDKISNNIQQIQTLTELRDTLLPRLISGKIKV